MGTSLESVNALKSRALEAALSNAEASALETNGITSLARLAFAACHPGQTPTEAQLQPPLRPIPLNPGNTASLKRLIFRIHPRLLSVMKWKSKPTGKTMHPPRLQEQKEMQESNNRNSGMLEKNCLLYLGPEKFPTRRHELLQKKPNKEISIDQSQLVVKEKQSDLTCPTVTELEVSNALKRRALAFDLVGVCTYDVVEAYHAELLDHLHTLPPPGYVYCTRSVMFVGTSLYVFPKTFWIKVTFRCVI